MRPIKSVKIKEERFATPNDKKLMAKARLKQAVIKILTKIQAYNIYEKIKRNKYCIIPVSKFVKGYKKLRDQDDSPDKWSNEPDNPDSPGAKYAANVTSGDSDHIFDEEIDSDMLVDEKGNIAAAIEYDDEEDNDPDEDAPFGLNNSKESAEDENNMKEIQIMS